MADTLVLVWLAVLSVAQVSWCLFYASAYDWRSTPLGPVWLAKGSALGVLWPTLLANQFVEVPDVAWVLIGGALSVGTVAWLVVTVRVWRNRRANQPRP